MLTDTHCHLDFNSYDTDRETTIQRSLESGVTTLLNPGIDVPTSQAAITLAESYPAVYAAVGIHPNETSSWEVGTASTLKRLAGNSRVVAIGEIGLDFYRQISSPEDQREVLTAQLGLADELGLPVIVHSRRSMDQVLEILSEWVTRLVQHNSPLAKHPGVLHSFEGTVEQAKRAIELNFYIGVTGPVTFKNASEKRSLVSTLPLECLLTETDSPFLTPHPFRGRRNEPAYIRYITETIATIHDVPVNTVAQITSSNAAQLFSWGVTD